MLDNEKHETDSMLLVCDFHPTLVSRILDVYRFFRNIPKIILIRRIFDGSTARFPTNSHLTVEAVTIPLPAPGVEQGRTLRNFTAVVSVIGYLLSIPFIYWKIQRRNTHVRLVHAHYLFPQGLFGILLASLFRVPLILTATGTDVNSTMRQSLLGRVLIRLIIDRAFVTIAVSKPIEQYLRQEGITNCTYIPNSIDTSSIRPVEDNARGDTILFAGRLIDSKRPLDLVRAFEIVVNRVPTAMLLLCGDGPMKAIVQEEIEKKNLQGKVKMYGFIGPSALNEVRSRASIFVLPSISEGLSLALLEAMAAGQAVIASRNESNASVLVNGESGLLYEPDNPTDLAAKILAAIEDKQLRTRLSQSARRVCQAEFSNEVAASLLESLYAKAGKVRDKDRFNIEQ